MKIDALLRGVYKENMESRLKTISDMIEKYSCNLSCSPEEYLQKVREIGTILQQCLFETIELYGYYAALTSSDVKEAIYNDDVERMNNVDEVDVEVGENSVNVIYNIYRRLSNGG